MNPDIISLLEIPFFKYFYSVVIIEVSILAALVVFYIQLARKVSYLEKLINNKTKK